MNIHGCCDRGSRPPGRAPVAARATRDNPRLPNGARRCLDLTQGIISAVVLVLLPKCPACVAAYVALGTGIGLTFSTAAHLRTAALTLGTVSLAFLTARAFHWIIRKILARS